MRNLTMTAARLRARLTRDDQGATPVEYGLFLSLIAVVIILGVTTFGSHLDDVFTTLKSKF